MKSCYYTILLCLMMAFPRTEVRGQDVPETPGVMFLEIGSDARGSAMGGMADLTSAGPFTAFLNPSAAFFSGNEIGAGLALSARKSFSEGNLLGAAAFYRLDAANLISLGFRNFGYSEITVSDGVSASADAFKPKELALDLGYGRRLSENLALSLTLRYIHSDLGSDGEVKKGNAGAADLGVTWVSPLTKMEGGYWKVALSANNFGTKIKYATRGYSLPSAIRGGAAVHLPFSENHKLSGTANLAYRLLPSSFSAFEAGAGAEYNLFRHAFLRAGYHFGDKEKGGGSFPTVGAGLTFGSFSFDCSYLIEVPEEEYRNILFLNLSFRY